MPKLNLNQVDTIKEGQNKQSPLFTFKPEEQKENTYETIEIGSASASASFKSPRKVVSKTGFGLERCKSPGFMPQNLSPI